MNQIVTPQICILGGGAAGTSAAATAVALGASVVLVEREELGRRSAAGGSMQTLIAAARRVEAIRAVRALFAGAKDAKANFPAVMAHVRDVAAAIAPNHSAARFAGLGVTVLRGAARFIDRRTVSVENTRVQARHFVIATGSSPALPPISGLQAVPFLTCDSLFGLKRVPSRLAIIGGGHAALEFAQAFRRLGSEVTVLEAGRALTDADPELVSLLVETLRAEGIDIREDVQIARVAKRGRSAVRLMLGAEGAETLDATHLLVTARRPNVDEIGLEKAGITFDEWGIAVDERLRTRNPQIYAVGDVVRDASTMLHTAEYQAARVIRSILAGGGTGRPQQMPKVTLTDPELASVGLSEAEAARRFGRISVLRWPFSENERARAEGATRGLVKLLATRKGLILGGAILGREAGELIAPLALAVAGGMNVRDVSAVVFPACTRAEALRRAAASFEAEQAQSSWLTRAVRLLRKRG